LCYCLDVIKKVTTKNNLINEDNTITINAKIENQTNKNTVTVSKKYDVNTNSTTNAYEAESILDALKNNETNTGLYSQVLVML